MNYSKTSFFLSLGFTLLGFTAYGADLSPRLGDTVPSAPLPGLCRETSEVPTDAFGFGAGSDVATLGSWGMGLEYGGAFGTRLARFQSHALKAQVSTSPLPCLEVGPSVIGGISRFSGSKLYDPNVDTSTLGGGIELKYKLLARADYGFGLTLGVEPTGLRSNTDPSGFSSFHSNVFGNQAKLLIDTELVKDRVYANFNVFHDANWTGISSFSRSSVLTLSSAFSFQVNKDVFLGVEGRHLRAYEGTFLNTYAGHAWFLGPTFLWKINDTFVLSGTYSRQLEGGAKGDTRTYDLTNFNRHQAKLKLGIAF